MSSRRATSRRLLSFATAALLGAIVASIPLTGCLADAGDASAEETGSVASELGVSNGFAIRNGAYLTNGVRLLNGVRLINGWVAKNGVRLINGLQVMPSALTIGAASVPNGYVFALTSGGELDVWLREDIVNNSMLLRYVTECALQPDQGIRFTVDGAVNQARGVLGLGSTWLNGAMTQSEQEKVTACLLARVNSGGIHIPIDLTATFVANPKMATSAQAPLSSFNPIYPLSEIVTYGNMFAPVPFLAGCIPGGESDVVKGVTTYPIKSEQQPNSRMCSTLPFASSPPLSKCGPLRTGRCADLCNYGWVGGRNIPVACGTSPVDRARYPNPITVRFAPKPPGSLCTYDWECSSSPVDATKVVLCRAGACSIAG